jgi:c-di-GMP-binding flagellar brake protein YcgR
MLSQDKRGFYRSLVSTEAEVVILDSETGRSIDCICHDISDTGMSVEMNEPLEVDTHLKIRIEACNNSVPSLDAYAKVVRCNELEVAEYLLGLELLEVN